MTQLVECSRCHKFIDTILTDEDIVVHHSDCYLEDLNEFKQGGIRIGLRIHESKDLKGTGGTYNNND